MSTALQVVQSLVGYQTRSWGLVVFAVLVIVTGGLAWVLNCIFPTLTMWTMKECSLDKAEYVYSKVYGIRCKLNVKQNKCCSVLHSKMLIECEL